MARRNKRAAHEEPRRHTLQKFSLVNSHRRAMKFFRATLRGLLLVTLVCRCTEETGIQSPSRRAEPGESLPIVRPLCMVLSNPARYDGTRITVRGCVTTGNREYVFLGDPSRRCGTMVPLDSPSLRSADRYTPEADKVVCGVFTGTFRISRVLGEPVLEVDSTSELKTSPLPGLR